MLENNTDHPKSLVFAKNDNVWPLEIDAMKMLLWSIVPIFADFAHFGRNFKSIGGILTFFNWAEIWSGNFVHMREQFNYLVDQRNFPTNETP